MGTFEELLTPDRSDAHRAAVHAFRPRRVPAAVVAAAALAALGAAVAAQVMAWRYGRPFLPPGLLHRADRLTRRLPADDPAVVALGGSVALAGLLCLLAAAIPGRGRVLPLSGEDPAFVAGVGRRGLCAALRAAALGVPGVSRARVRLRRRPPSTVVVRAITCYRNPESLREQVAATVRARLDALGLIRAPRVTVRLRGRDD